MQFTKNFTQLDSDSVDIAGGKGASLGEMTSADIPVPPGFVVLSNAFQKFLEQTDLKAEIDSELHEVNKDDTNSIEEASEKIRAQIRQADFPTELKEEIQQAFDDLDSEYVAVRSSATEEDSDDAAWAGQLDTFLNTTQEDLFENIRECWSSLFTPRAIFYLFENYGENAHTKEISVAVVIQEMIDSDISGVAFSVHPVTEDENQLIIEACFGLGEAIVSGQITPDSYVIEKEPRRILENKVGTQKKALQKNPEKQGEEKNEWQQLDEQEGSKQVLEPEQIKKMSELVMKIEKHYGFPCDIEWCMKDGEFYIVQSRPITTLS